MLISSNLLLAGGVLGSALSAHSVPPTVEARYWRVLVLENYSRGSVPATSADSIQMRAVLSGANLATDSSKAISDSEFSGSYINDYAFNGINSQFWVSLNKGGSYGTHWIGYDFTTAVAINEIVWSKRPDSFGRSEAPVIGLVQRSSDGSSWTTDWSFVTPATWSTGAESRTFSKPTSPGHRFWRIKPTAVQGGASYPFSAAELELRESAGGVNQAAGGFVLSSAFDGTYTAAKVFDGNTAGGVNFGLATGTTPSSGSWIGYAFPTMHVGINEVVYQVRGDSFGANEAIIDADVQWSDDLSTWTTDWNFTTPSTWVNNSTESRIFNK